MIIKVKKAAYSVLATIAAVMLLFAPLADAADMVDVSSWQTGINITETGAEIVVAKATEGVGYVNPDCDRVVQDALAVGQGVGVYHFAHTENSAAAEARYFIDNTRGYIGKGIVPILDWEPTQPWRVEWAAEWLRIVGNAYGTKPIIYMNQNTENSYDWSAVVAGDYGLWVAAYTLGYTPIYGYNPPNVQPTLYNWPFAVAWQYTSTGYVNGWSGALDLSVVYGDLDTWYAYANSTPPKVVEPVPEPDKPTTDTCADNCRIIKSGEYVSMFWADWWNVSVPSGNPSLVYPGDKVCHKGGGATTASRTYVVRSGDTLSGIATRLGVNMHNITGYRSGNVNLIYPGEVLHY